MEVESRLAVEAPAKINLGLEVLGKRADGYHEIRSVLAMVDVYDTVLVGDPLVMQRCHVDAGKAQDNLVQRALEAYRQAVPGSQELTWHLDKRIPIASGLGGASSDAAAALLAANALCPTPLSHSELVDLAATLGSDVPFFLGAPFALATGRGTELIPAPAVELELLLVVPREAIQGKTRTLYGLLRPCDFIDTNAALRVVEALRLHQVPEIGLLRNAFARALCELLPGVASLQERLRSESTLVWGLSGAGPAHYILAGTSDQPGIARWLHSEFGEWLDIRPARTLALAPHRACARTEQTL